MVRSFRAERSCLAGLTVLTVAWSAILCRGASTVVPIAQPVTHGPGYHWFGYYDKWQFDPSDRFLLCMRVDLESGESELVVSLADIARLPYRFGEPGALDGAKHWFNHLLGDFHSPPRYRGEWRCDTHPRSSRDGTRVVIDSTHGGAGRRRYLIEVSAILAGTPPNPSQIPGRSSRLQEKTPEP